ncbi:hypothetical protein AGMMS49975_11660 [Clostridia bacterium]|nr:hypothetical protein AGMMS49975_11660 [Clostridia bacterium]
MKKVVVIDGQGGKLGKLLIEEILLLGKENIGIYAVGTNALATSLMLKAGADYGATGENAVIVNAKDADIITGPIGIIAANSLLGELTPKMAEAVGASGALKVLLPISKCNNRVVGVRDLSLLEFAKLAAKQIITGD